MRAQVVIVDMALSVVLALALIFFTHSLFLTDDESMQYDAYLISEQLVNYEGYPSDWTNETVEILGLSEGRGRVSSEKISELGNLNYKEMRALLGSEYDITIYIDKTPVTSEKLGSKNFRFSRLVIVDGYVRNLGVVLSKA